VDPATAKWRETSGVFGKQLASQRSSLDQLKKQKAATKNFLV
jgi:hypothetical protein